MCIKRDTSFDGTNSTNIISSNETNAIKKLIWSLLKHLKMHFFYLSVSLNILLIGCLISFVVYHLHQCKPTKPEKRIIEYDIVIRNEFQYSPVVSKPIPPLWKHPIVADINCNTYLQKNERYVNDRPLIFKKLADLQSPFSTSCKDIKRRGYYPDKPMSEEEGNFSIAYVRTIYSDYLTLEYQFLLTYAPQNHYCFVIDKKQNSDFHSRMFALSNCFNNVHIISNRFVMDSNGNNLNNANYECMKYLSDKNFKYLIILNNDDMPLKTNREMVEILKIYDGAIDIEYADPKPYLNSRINYNLNWDLKHLEIFKKGDPRSLNESILSSKLKFQKGYVQIAYPKKTVDYLVNELNITKYLNQLNDMKLYANDEFSFQTLISNEYLNIPGKVDSECFEIDDIFKKSFMTRYTKWSNEEECKESEIRHTICLQNIKTLHKIKNLPHLFVNKFKALSDFGGLTCWAEYLYNRTYFKPYIPINKTFYENLPIVRYEKLKSLMSDKKKLCDMSKKYFPYLNFNLSVN